MRTQINDIRIRSRSNEKEILDLHRVKNEVRPTFGRGGSILDESHKDISLESKGDCVKIKDAVSLKRRKFLKTMAISGGALIAGSFLNKINKFKSITLINQPASASALGSVATESKSRKGVLDEGREDFFKNFRLVQNKKEFVLYNKQGDSIITIDRDA